MRRSILARHRVRHSPVLPAIYNLPLIYHARHNLSDDDTKTFKRCHIVTPSEARGLATQYNEDVERSET